MDKDDKEIIDPERILENLKEYYSSLFESKSEKTENDCQTFLSQFQNPSLSAEDRDFCEREITVSECFNAL